MGTNVWIGSLNDLIIFRLTRFTIWFWKLWFSEHSYTECSIAQQVYHWRLKVSVVVWWDIWSIKSSDRRTFSVGTKIFTQAENMERLKILDIRFAAFFCLDGGSEPLTFENLEKLRDYLLFLGDTTNKLEDLDYTAVNKTNILIKTLCLSLNDWNGWKSCQLD